MAAYIGSFAQGFIDAFLKAQQLRMYRRYFQMRMDMMQQQMDLQARTNNAVIKRIAADRAGAGTVSDLRTEGGGRFDPNTALYKGGYSYNDMVGMAEKAGFKGQDAQIMASIAMAESRGNPNASHINAKDGSTDWGLTQINDKAWPGAKDALDPQTSFNKAYDIYSKAGNTFTDWTTFKTGAYKDFIPPLVAGGDSRQDLAAISAHTEANRPGDTSNLNPTFSAKLYAAIQDYNNTYGGHVGLESGFRTPGQTGSSFDASGRSLHTYGLASDVNGFTAGSQEAHDFYNVAIKHGIFNPYGPDDPKEWNHYQAIDHELKSDEPLYKDLYNAYKNNDWNAIRSVGDEAQRVTPRVTPAAATTTPAATPAAATQPAGGGIGGAAGWLGKQIFGQADTAIPPYQVAGPWEPPPAGGAGAALQQHRAEAFPAEQHRIITDPEVARAWPGPPITSTPPHTPTPIPGSQQGPESPYAPPDLNVYNTRPLSPSDMPSSGVGASVHDSRYGPLQGYQTPPRMGPEDIKQTQATAIPPVRPKDLGATPGVATKAAPKGKAKETAIPPTARAEVPPAATFATTSDYRGMPVGGRGGGRETPTGMVGGQQITVPAQFHAPPNWTQNNPPVQKLPPPNLKANTPHPGEIQPAETPAAPGIKTTLPQAVVANPPLPPSRPQDTTTTATTPPPSSQYTGPDRPTESGDTGATPAPAPAPAPSAPQPVVPDTGHYGSQFASNVPMPPPSNMSDWDRTNYEMMMADQDQGNYAIPLMPLYSQHGGPVPGAPTQVPQTANTAVGSMMRQGLGQTQGTQNTLGGSSINFASTLGNPQASTLPGLQMGGPVSPKSRSHAIPRRQHLDLTRKGFVRQPFMQGGGPLTQQRPELNAQWNPGRSAVTTYGSSSTPGVSLQGGGDPQQAGTDVPSEQPSFVSGPVVTSDASVSGLQSQTAAGQSMMGSMAAHEGDLAGDVAHTRMRHQLQAKQNQVSAGQTPQQAQQQSPVGQFMNQIPYVQQLEQWKSQMASWPTIFNPGSAPQQPAPFYAKGGIVYRFQAGGAVDEPPMTPEQLDWQTGGYDDTSGAIPPGSYQEASLNMMPPSAGVRIPHMMGGTGGGGMRLSMPSPRMGVGGTGIPRAPAGAGRYATDPSTDLLPEGYSYTQDDAHKIPIGTPQIADDQGHPAKGYTNAVLDGVGWMASQLFGTGIPKQGAQAGGGGDAASDADMKQIYKTVDPDNILNDGMKNIAALNAVHEYYMLNGDPQMAQQYAGMMVAYSRELAGKYGDVALKHLGQKNYDEAVKAEIEAGNIIPNGYQYTANQEQGQKDGHYMLNEHNLNGQVLWSQEIGPREIMAAALGLKSGMAFWNAVQRFGAEYDPEGKQLLAAKDKADEENRLAGMEAAGRAQVGGGYQPYTPGGGGGGPGVGGARTLPVNLANPPLGDETGETAPDTGGRLISPTVNPAAGTGAYRPSDIGSPTALTPKPSTPSTAPPSPGPPVAPPDQGQETAIPRQWEPYQVAGAMQPPPSQAQPTPRVTPDVSQAVFGAPTPSPAAAPVGAAPSVAAAITNMPVINTQRLIEMRQGINQRYFDPQTGNPIIGDQVFTKPNRPTPTGNRQVDNINNAIFNSQMTEWTRQYQQNLTRAQQEYQTASGGYRMDVAGQKQQMLEADKLRREQAMADRQAKIDADKNKIEQDKLTNERQKIERPLPGEYSVEYTDADGTEKKMAGIKASELATQNAFASDHPGMTGDALTKAQKDDFKTIAPKQPMQNNIISGVDDIVRFNHTHNSIGHDIAASYAKSIVTDPNLDDPNNFKVTDFKGPDDQPDAADDRVEIQMRDETGAPAHFIMSKGGFDRLNNARTAYIAAQKAKPTPPKEPTTPAPVQPAGPSGPVGGGFGQGPPRREAAPPVPFTLPQRVPGSQVPPEWQEQFPELRNQQ